jgi:hypothetical protein
MLTRRQFTNGSAAIVSGGIVDGLGAHLVQSESVHFIRRLPIPPLIDAAKQGYAVKLKVTSGRRAFWTSYPPAPGR